MDKRPGSKQEARIQPRVVETYVGGAVDGRTGYVRSPDFDWSPGTGRRQSVGGLPCQTAAGLTWRHFVKTGLELPALAEKL